MELALIYFKYGAILATITTIAVMIFQNAWNITENKTQREKMLLSFQTILIVFFGTLFFYPLAIGLLVIALGTILFISFFKMIFLFLEKTFNFAINMLIRLENFLKRDEE
jgi:O-antigen/teichoic acid export membrane protein